jgi:ATP-dependent Clp protease ATP-binding subunit ClpA
MMTSNIGGSLAGEASEENRPKRRIGFVTEPEAAPAEAVADRRGNYLKALKAQMRPELINRVGEDGIVVFNELGEKQLEAILDLRVSDLQAQLAEKKVTVSLTPAARAEILKRAEAQKAYGARPLKQIVERQVAQAIVAADLEGLVGEGDAVSVDWNGTAFTASRR